MLWQNQGETPRPRFRTRSGDTDANFLVVFYGNWKTKGHFLLFSAWLSGFGSLQGGFYQVLGAERCGVGVGMFSDDINAAIEPGAKSPDWVWQMVAKQPSDM